MHWARCRRRRHPSSALRAAPRRLRRERHCPRVLPRTEGAIGDGLTGWPAPAAGDPPGPATFALGTPLPTVLPRAEGVIGDGLTVIGWPTPVGAAPGVTVPAFTFGTTPLGMERCAPPPTPTPPPTPIPPSEPPALP